MCASTALPADTYHVASHLQQHPVTEPISNIQSSLKSATCHSAEDVIMLFTGRACVAYRDYGSTSQGNCAITGNPPVSTITAGAALPPANCACSDASQCAAVNSSSLSTNATGWGAATLNGALSAQPFSNVRNETCFDGSILANPSDTYRVSGWTHALCKCSLKPADLPSNHLFSTLESHTHAF